MRKLFLTLGVLLIIVAIAGPFVTGKFAEKAVRDNEAAIQASLPPWLELVEQTFDRGWFTSRSSARLVITDPAMRERMVGFLGADQFGDQPAVIVQSSVTHGPLVNLVTPALADIKTAFLTEGESRDRLPVNLATRVGLTGTLDMHWRVDNGSYAADIGTLRWEGLTASNSVTPMQNEVDIRLQADVLALDRDESPVLARDFAIEWSARERDGAFASAIEADTDIINAQQPPMRLALGVGIEDLPPQAVPALARILQTVAANNEMPMPVKLRVIEGDLRTLLANDFTVTMQQRLKVEEASDGVMRTDISLQFAAIDAAGAAGLDASRLIERAARGGRSKVDMVINQPMMDALQERDPTFRQQILQMQAFGALVPEPDGDGYMMDMEYKDALITLNGIPMPVPPEAF